MKNNIKPTKNPGEHFNAFEAWEDLELEDGYYMDKTELLRRELKEEFDREMLRRIAIEDMEDEYY